MSLIQLDIRDVTITAEKVGEHFAIHPTILHNADSGDFALSADVWDVEHLPSNRLMFHIHQDDPLEYPGEPRAVDLDKVRKFLTWLEEQLDWSGAEPDMAALSDEARGAIALFRADPNYYDLAEGLR